MKVKFEAIQPVFMVRDVPRAITFYELLGFKIVFCDNPQDPRYAGVRRDEVEVHLQWHESAELSHPGDHPTYRFVVSDVDALYAEFIAAGVEGMNFLGATAWGTREFHVLDPDRNGLQFYRDRP